MSRDIIGILPSTSPSFAKSFIASLPDTSSGFASVNLESIDFVWSRLPETPAILSLKTSFDLNSLASNLDIKSLSLFASYLKLVVECFE